MRTAIYNDLTLQQFLRLPETKPALEYVRGKVVQKVSPLFPHAKLEQTLWLWIYQYSIQHHLGECFVGLRCTFGGESVVPDLVYFAPGRVPTDPSGLYASKGADSPPDLIIEILSPGQTLKAMSNRLSRQIRGGVRLAWLIQQSRKRVFVFRPDTECEVVEAGGVLDGEAVLPDFRLPVSELFGWLSVGSKPFPGAL